MSRLNLGNKTVLWAKVTFNINLLEDYVILFDNIFIKYSVVVFFLVFPHTRTASTVIMSHKKFTNTITAKTH